MCYFPVDSISCTIKARMAKDLCNIIAPLGYWVANNGNFGKCKNCKNIYSDTTPGHVSTQLHLRDFLKPEGVSVYLQLYGIFILYFLLDFPWVCGKYWIPNNFFTRSFTSSPLSSIYSEPCTCYFQCSEYSFCTGRKKEWWSLLLFSTHQTWFYKPLYSVSSVYLCSRLKNTRYILITHTKIVLLFWSPFSSCSPSCPTLLYLLLRWTV